MTFLPIVERELRQRARWRSTYWVRGTVAFLATAIAMFVLMFLAEAAPGSTGKFTINVLGALAFLFAAVEGLRNTADSLSAEKREGTLGLLFLTDLRGYDVVLGKFFASSLTSFYALLAMIPALGVPVLLGGVTGAEFWRLVLALVNALFFSLAAGMFVSSISRHERVAFAGTAFVMLLFMVLIPALSWSWNWIGLRVWSPWTAFSLYDDNGYAASSDHYWSSIWITNALGWLWLILASLLLPHVWQEARVRYAPRRRAETAFTRRRRNKLLAISPVWWLTSRHTHRRGLIWGFVAALTVAGVVGFFAAQSSTVALWIFYGCAIAIHFVLAVWVASEACHSFADARSTGAMELLLSTPLHVRQILRGQHLALRELFLGPFALLLFVETGLAVAQVWLMRLNNEPVFGCVMLVLMLGFSLVWFVLDLLAVAETGLWFGLTSKTPTQALTKTVGFVLVLPLLIMAVPCCWGLAPGLMVGKGIILFIWAQSKLENEFRRAATERYELSRLDQLLRRAPQKLKMPGGT